MNLTANQIADLALAQQLAPRLEPAANDTPALRPFVVAIKRGAAVIKHFEAMGVDALAVAQQHEGLCAEGEYVRAVPLAVSQEEAREAALAVFERQRNVEKSTGADLDRRAARHAEAEERALRAAGWPV